ncbi:MAG: response regulator [Candidatus Eisenbacteria bacterium]|nr:response regulator [Candidatus Eisenbacteria bacterium]
MSETKGEEPRAKLLIVDDDPDILSQLNLALRREFEVRAAESSKAAWEMIAADPPELMTLDLALDDDDPESGFTLLERALQSDPLLKIVLITGNDEENNALRAIEQGAADFLGKPVEIEELRVLLRRLQVTARRERQNAQLLQQLGARERLGSIVGRSKPMRAVYRRIKKAAAVDIAVLVLGKSGTGKELVARELRRLSDRATKPFVSINCGAIPDNLVESELFGHVKGSFTDARESRPGRLELAEGGIVFLDEIGELPLTSQVKLTRFLQEHEIERVGGRETIELDVRVIAATSKNLAEEVEKGAFRQDLYYRLSVVEITLPPLRERGEDILFLAYHFLDRYAQQFERGRLGFTQQARVALQQHEWPGNVRELEHRIQRAVVMSSGRQVGPADLELEHAACPRRISLKKAREEADREMIREALQLTGGNISLAAETLGISRPSLHALLSKLDIRARDYKPAASSAHKS